MSSEFFGKLQHDFRFRTKLFLGISLSWNLVYSVFLFAVSFIEKSKWFLVMSVYYVLLFSARTYILTTLRSRQPKDVKIKAMRILGYFLLLINLAVSTMVFILIRDNTPVKYHEITVITLATYTFSSLTVAIIHSIRYFKKNNLLYFCVKIISLTTASVSLVTLTNTMLATFGEANILLRSIVLPILSAFVSILIITCAILIILRTKEHEKN